MLGARLNELERMREQPEAFLTYRIAYKCKHCRKEWNTISTKEVKIPEAYIDSEQGKGEGE